MLGENTEKYITFSVPTEKEVIRTSKNGKDITNTLSYRLKFIDNVRFMTSWLSHLVYHLDKRIHKIKCKYSHDNKKCKACGIKCKDCECCLEYRNVKNDLIERKCLFCNKNYQKNSW